MILLSHPTANQNVRQAALAFAAAGLLSEFWTCVNWKRHGLLDRVLEIAPGLRNELRRRSFPDETRPFVRSYSFREWGRQIASRLDWQSLIGDEKAAFSIDSVYHSLDRRVAKQLARSLTIKAVYGYDSGVRESFCVAKGRGILCFYEHPIVHWRISQRLQREEAELQPEWAPTLPALSDSNEKLARKDEELALADLIIVPSSFASGSLAQAPNVTAPIRVVPYGTGAVRPVMPRLRMGGRLRVLFVGGLSQAKGLGYLLHAVAEAGDKLELTLIGRRVSMAMPKQSVLDRHRWIPSVSHPDLMKEMAQHDVLVLPSLNEGFGLVLSEAMAQGLTVITTSHTAGPDLFTDGVEGFIVPIRSAEAIAERLLLLERERDRLATMQEAARRRAMTNDWENYRQRLVALAREVMAREPAS